jgi:hypothetical protein
MNHENEGAGLEVWKMTDRAVYSLTAATIQIPRRLAILLFLARAIQ